MSDSVSSEPLATIVCTYCGQENSGLLTACAECGTPLATSEETGPKSKSKVLAVSLALILGPLGLFYLRAWWSAFILLFFFLLLAITHNADIWASIVIRILCAVWAYRIVTDLNKPESDRDSARLLDEAARLEAVDPLKAIVAYENIIRLYPDTHASREAQRNVQTLKRQP